jgi:hypothetical protein
MLDHCTCTPDPKTPADAEAAYPPSDPRYPGDMSDPNAGATPRPDTFACLGCGLAYDDIARFKIPDRDFRVSLPYSARMLPLCSACEKDAATLAKVIATEIRRSTAASDGRRIAALFALRDKVLEDKVLDMVALRTSEVNAVLNRHHGAIDECRAALGLDTVKRDDRRKRGLIGALAGGGLGLIIGLTPKPLEALREAVAKLQELLAQVGPQTPASPDEDPRLRYAA